MPKKRSIQGKRSATRKKVQPQRAPKSVKRDVIGILLVAVGVLSVYFVLNSSVTGAGLAIRRFLRGIAGDLSFLISLILLWLGLVFCLSSGGRTVRKGHVPLVILLFILLLGFIELFSVETVNNRLSYHTYGNALMEAYRLESGAGLLGMLTAWLLCRTLGLGIFASIIIYIALFTLILVLLRKISLDRLREKTEAGISQVQEKVRTIAEERKNRQAAYPSGSRYEDEAKTVIPTVAPRRSGRRSADPTETAEETYALHANSTGKKKTAVSFDDLAVESEADLSSPVQRGLKASIEARKRASVQDRSTAGSGESVFGKAPESGLSSWRTMQENNSEDIPVDIPDITKTKSIDIFLTEKNGTGEAPDEEDRAPAAGSYRKEASSRKPSGEQGSIFTDSSRISVPAADTGSRDPEPKVTAADKGIAYEAPMPIYSYPPVELLSRGRPGDRQINNQADAEKGRKLVEILKSFNIETTLIGILHGPSVTLYELAPAPGVKVSRITNLVDDIALGLAAKSVRIEAPIPGKSAVGVEVPNEKRESVPLRDVLESEEAKAVSSRIAAGIGRDNNGNYIICDIAKMPHLLIAGSTGSGKSVCINCIICSILYRATPEEVRLILIDPKKVELSVYNTIPHLLVPVVSDPKKAAGALEWVVTEMEQRYEKFKEVGARDLRGYNKKLPEGEKPMPQIVVIIDELADLMMVAPIDIEDAICRIAQLARACGIHLVIATQRPSVNVITGLIKANIASRIAFTVASFVDSRTILDYGGAEKLLMRGDMLYAPSGIAKPLRVQGAWIDDDEVASVVSYISRHQSTDYNEDLAEKLDKAELSDAEKAAEESDSDCDPLLAESIEAAIAAGEISVSMLQRKFRIGYARAGRIVDEMTKRGIISEKDGSKPRAVLITTEQFHEMFGENR